MMLNHLNRVVPLAKAPTGIVGFDEITRGGLPRGRTTLLGGGPGSGKTVFSMQFLTHGALECGEPGIFVAFEETSQRIVANFEGFVTDLADLPPERLAFIDAQPTPDLIQVGNFDLGGLIAALEAQTQAMKARRIVFDTLDIVLALLPDAAARRRELYRLHAWLLAQSLTGLITSNIGGGTVSGDDEQPMGFMQFMVDCSVVLNHTVRTGVSHRNVRVQKYRGSSFDENETPFVIGRRGLDVATARTVSRPDANGTHERVTSGVERLDTMLGGGYHRGASVLITGSPGTAKTTLSATFAEAACSRRERTVFISFDSDGPELIPNLASVGIRLGRFVDDGSLRIISARTVTGSAETCFMQIKVLVEDHDARCLVIDPMSTLAGSGNEATAHGVGERLIDWSKAAGITMVCTSLFDATAGQADGGSPLQISTLADTWIHLEYLMRAGERNRGISIIKSRGTAHSSQVRELVLSDSGVTLAALCMAGEEVLMGTMRSEKESAARGADEVAVVGKLRRVELDAEEAELEVRVRSLQEELVAKQVEKALLMPTTASRERPRGRAPANELRGADAASPGRNRLV